MRDSLHANVKRSPGPFLLTDGGCISYHVKNLPEEARKTLGRVFWTIGKNKRTDFVFSWQIKPQHNGGWGDTKRRLQNPPIAETEISGVPHLKHSTNLHFNYRYHSFYYNISSLRSGTISYVVLPWSTSPKHTT